MRTTSIGIPGLISCALLSLTMRCGQANEEAQPAATTHTLTDSLRQIISLDTIQEAPLHGELNLWPPFTVRKSLIWKNSGKRPSNNSPSPHAT